MDGFFLFICFLTFVCPFIVFNLGAIYDNDKGDKRWGKNLKLIDLKGFKNFFFFYNHKEGKMSMRPFVCAIVVYSCFIAMISLCVIGIWLRLSALISISFGLYIFQFLFLCFPIGCHSAKYIPERDAEKKEKLRLQQEKWLARKEERRKKRNK